jgi:hypothetical protein
VSGDDLLSSSSSFSSSSSSSSLSSSDSESSEEDRRRRRRKKRRERRRKRRKERKSSKSLTSSGRLINGQIRQVIRRDASTLKPLSQAHVNERRRKTMVKLRGEKAYLINDDKNLGILRSSRAIADGAKPLVSRNEPPAVVPLPVHPARYALRGNVEQLQRGVGVDKMPVTHLPGVAGVPGNYELQFSYASFFEDAPPPIVRVPLFGAHASNSSGASADIGVASGADDAIDVDDDDVGALPEPDPDDIKQKGVAKRKKRAPSASAKAAARDYILNAGGIVTCMDWSMHASASEPGYLAVGTRCDSKGETARWVQDRRKVRHAGAMQIWSAGSLDGRLAPRLALLLLHEHGGARDLQWLPYSETQSKAQLGGQQKKSNDDDAQTLPIIGHLAVSFDDGTVLAVAVPRPGALMTPDDTDSETDSQSDTEFDLTAEDERGRKRDGSRPALVRLRPTWSVCASSVQYCVKWSPSWPSVDLASGYFLLSCGVDSKVNVWCLSGAEAPRLIQTITLPGSLGTMYRPLASWSPTVPFVLCAAMFTSLTLYDVRDTVQPLHTHRALNPVTSLGWPPHAEPEVLVGTTSERPLIVNFKTFHHALLPHRRTHAVTDMSMSIHLYEVAVAAADGSLTVAARPPHSSSMLPVGFKSKARRKCVLVVDMVDYGSNVQRKKVEQIGEQKKKKNDENEKEKANMAANDDKMKDDDEEERTTSSSSSSSSLLATVNNFQVLPEAVLDRHDGGEAPTKEGDAVPLRLVHPDSSISRVRWCQQRDHCTWLAYTGLTFIRVRNLSKYVGFKED